jgi:N-acetylmuramoyl-L-alanine amidase
MSTWARVTLFGAMCVWTSLTIAAGWLAFAGAPGTSPEPANTVIYDAAGPGEPRTIRVLGESEARARIPAVPAPEPDGAIRLRNVGAPQPAPKYAVPAGVDRRVRALDADKPKKRTAAAPKGVIVLDPGHGRGDPGAVHYKPDGHYYTEAESNLRNAELIRDALIAMGYDVYLTRDGAGLGPGAPLPLQFITSDLYARVGLAHAVQADVFVAIHGNGATNTSIRGPETWYCGKHSEGNANERLARMLQDAQVAALRDYGYDGPDRGIKEDAGSHHSGDFCQFVVTREAPVPAALIEFLFLSNPLDAAVLLDDHAHQLLAVHVADAIDLFMRREYGNR